MAGRKRTKTENIDERYNKPFAKRLRNLIEERGKVHAEIAAYFGISRQAVGKWANGETTPDLETIVKLADHFGVSTDYILGKNVPPSVDTDIQAVCKYTKLSEKAINTIVEYSITNGFFYSDNGNYFTPTILNAVLENNLFYSLINYFGRIKNLSARCDNKENISDKMLHDCAKTLGISEFVIVKHLNIGYVTSFEERDIDIQRYYVARTIEQISDTFDSRVKYEKFSVDDWRNYLGISEQKLKELQAESAAILERTKHAEALLSGTTDIKGCD